MSAVVVIVLMVVLGFVSLAAALVYIAASDDEGCGHDPDCGDVR